MTRPRLGEKLGPPKLVPFSPSAASAIGLLPLHHDFGGRSPALLLSLATTLGFSALAELFKLLRYGLGRLVLNASTLSAMPRNLGVDC